LATTGSIAAGRISQIPSMPTPSTASPTGRRRISSTPSDANPPSPISKGLIRVRPSARHVAREHRHAGERHQREQRQAADDGTQRNGGVEQPLGETPHQVPSGP